MTKTESLEDAVALLEANVEDLGRRSDPAVRQIVIDGDVRRIRETHKTDAIPDKHLAPTYVQDITREALDRFVGETRAIDRAVSEKYAELRERTVEEIAKGRRLPSESERLNPNTNHAAWVAAKMLDEYTEDKAEGWLDNHERDEAATLKRYKTADDRQDNAFVRVVEKRYGREVDESTDEQRKVAQMIVSPLVGAVRERQESRVRPGLRGTLERLNKVRDSIEYSRGLTNPTNENIGRALSAAIRRAK